MPTVQANRRENPPQVGLLYGWFGRCFVFEKPVGEVLTSLGRDEERRMLAYYIEDGILTPDVEEFFGVNFLQRKKHVRPYDKGVSEETYCADVIGLAVIGRCIHSKYEEAVEEFRGTPELPTITAIRDFFETRRQSAIANSIRAGLPVAELRHNPGHDRNTDAIADFLGVNRELVYAVSELHFWSLFTALEIAEMLRWGTAVPT